jgi:hypothetical protein
MGGVLPRIAIAKKTMSTPDLVSTFASGSVSGSSPSRPDDLINGVRSSMAVGCRPNVSEQVSWNALWTEGKKKEVKKRTASLPASLRKFR